LGVDFRQADIDGIIFDHGSLEGIIVNSFQCHTIVLLFGVRVED